MDLKTISCVLCGRSIVLVSLWSNPCACGAEYNGIGQILAQRSKYREKSSDHPTDLSIMDLDHEIDGDFD